MANDIENTRERGKELYEQFLAQNKQSGSGSEQSLINSLSKAIVEKEREIDDLARTEPSFVRSALKALINPKVRIPGTSLEVPLNPITGPSITSAEGAASASRASQLKELEDELMGLQFALFIATRRVGNKARIEALQNARNPERDAQAKKSKKSKRGEVKNPTIDKLLDERSKNFNIVGFDVAAFVDNILSSIELKRVRQGFVNSLNVGEIEPKINTFYRIIGLPPAGTAKSLVQSAADITDNINAVTAARKAEFNFRIDRGLPGISTSGKSNRFLFPAVDQVVKVPVGNRVLFPFINTVIALKINKFDDIGNIDPSGNVPELAFVEKNIVENIDKLIEHFPTFLLKQIQKDARYRTVSNVRNNVEDPDGEGQLKANNGTFTIDAVTSRGATQTFEMTTSKLQQTQAIIEEELDVENSILALLPLQEVGNNELGSTFLGLLNHNRSFLNRIKNKVKEFSETINTEQRKREHALTLIEGIPPTTSQSADELGFEKRKQLSNSITAIEIMAVLSALFNSNDDDLLAIAINNNIPSSQELAASLIIERQRAENQNNTSDPANILQTFLDNNSLNSALSRLNTKINTTVVRFTKIFDEARSKVKDEKTGLTFAKLDKQQSELLKQKVGSTGSTQNTSPVNRGGGGASGSF